MPTLPTLSALLAAGSAALYQGIALRCYSLSTPKWKRGRSLRFALISDLHSVLFGDAQRHILTHIRRLQPDHILLAGDIVDEHRPPKNAHAFLQGAAGIAPSWYALGNHEYRTRCVPAVVRMAQSCGVTTLLDDSVRLSTPAGPLVVAGCEDPEKTLRGHADYHWQTSIHRHFGGLGQSDAFTVLIAHHPEHSAIYARLGVDLAVSGHAHGGQVRIPFLVNGLYAPSQGLFPPDAGGCYRRGQTAHIVSRGVVVYPHVPRIFNPPEIVSVDVVGTGER